MTASQCNPVQNPIESLTYVDTHTHLDDPAFDADRTAVIERARSAGVTRMLNIGYAPSRWRSTVALAEQVAGMAFTIGLHPGHAEEWTDHSLIDIERLARGHGACAIGEIGLDFAHETPDPASQRRAFMDQLALAQTLDLPVVIHQRAAGAECASILAGTPPNQPVVLHSYDGNAELLDLGLDRGWTFGVGGLMTRRSSESIRLALTNIPLDQLIIETDAPYLTPRGLKFRRNTPESIPHIARVLADLLHLQLDEVATATTDTAARVFRLKDAQDEM